MLECVCIDDACFCHGILKSYCMVWCKNERKKLNWINLNEKEMKTIHWITYRASHINTGQEQIQWRQNNEKIKRRKNKYITPKKEVSQLYA